jgi:hypothetical protein
MPISIHLNHKPFQVAVSTDPTLPLRKWNHIGTVWHVSSRSAVFHFRSGESWGTPGRHDDPSSEAPGFDGGVIYGYPDGQFIHVKN